MLICSVHRYGIFKFRTSASSAPTTPSSTAHRLRPSMLNLDTISRNLFGTGSVSSRSHSNSASGTDTFGTSSTKMSRSVLSRTSTMEASSRLSVQTRSTSSEDLKKGHSRPSRSPSSEHLAESELITGRPYSANGVAGMGQSEMDLNERLNTARKNSKSTAALSPKPSGARKLGSKSVAELRSQVETSQSNQADGSLTEIREFLVRDSTVNVQFSVAPLRRCRQRHRCGFEMNRLLPRKHSPSIATFGQRMINQSRPRWRFSAPEASQSLMPSWTPSLPHLLNKNVRAFHDRQQPRLLYPCLPGLRAREALCPKHRSSHLASVPLTLVSESYLAVDDGFLRDAKPFR